MKLARCFILGVCAWSAAVSTAMAEDTRPNIVLVVVDTLRRDHVGCYGYSRNTTPNMDRLAKDGMKFDQMITCSSWTIPSLMSIFTSQPSSLHQATNYEHVLAKDTTTLAQELKNGGYETAGFVSNPSASTKFGFGRGFDLYDDFTVVASVEMNAFQEFDKGRPIRDAVTSPVVNRLVLDWLENKRDKTKPFFTFMLYIDPHANYVPPAPYDKKFDPEYKGTANINMFEAKKEFSDQEREHAIALYDGEIANVDDHIGRVLKKLDELNLSQNTIVIITADHGEELWDHGGILHGHTLYDELIRVPFIVRWPNKVAAGSTTKSQVSQLSIMPTVLEAVGTKLPKQCQGVSVLPGLLGKEEIKEQTAFLETDTFGWDNGRNLRGIRTTEGKIIFDLNTNKQMAFDLKSDPKELRDVMKAPPAWHAALLRRADEWWIAVSKAEKINEGTTKADIDPKLLEELRQLGYSQ